jgi:hypothetical protein
MPATEAQVFGPTAVTVNYSTTGEKTLLTMNTALPAGGKNVIMAVFMQDPAVGDVAGTFRIKKGTTILYETGAVERLHWGVVNPKVPMVIAVDNNPTGNDTYTFVVNVTTAIAASGVCHVQGIVIKVADTDIATSFNTTAVSVTGGNTATITSLTTNFPSGSKVAVVAHFYAYQNTYSGNVVISAGGVRIKLNGTAVSSNEFALGSWWSSGSPPNMARITLAWFGTLSTSTQTWSVEMYNSSTTTFQAFAILVAFLVFDGAFLDTASVALTQNVLTTVGNLSTTLQGDVVVIALASSENPTGYHNVAMFNSGNVVLQLDNSATGQIANQVNWMREAGSYQSRAGILPLFRLDTDVTNPSYQVKMAPNYASQNGEAKILAFVLLTGLQIKRVFGETVRETEGSIFGRDRFRISAESVNLSELGRVARNLVRLPLEAVNLVESMVGARIRVRVIGEAERISEAFRALRNRIRQVLEGLSVLEAIARSRRRFRAITENVLLSEAILRVRRMAKIVGETVRSLESAVRSRVITRLVSEAVRISEAHTSFSGKVKAVIEGLQLSEVVRRSRRLGRVVPEQIRVSESISKAVRFVKILGETVNLSEAFRAVRSRFRSVSESLRIFEVVTHFKGAVRVVGEVLNLGELSRSVRNRFKQVGEAVNIGEVFARIRTMFRSASESVAILAGRLVSRAMARVADEVVSIGETLVRFKGRALSILESINILESKLFRRVKTYIDRLVSALRGTAVGGEV